MHHLTGKEVMMGKLMEKESFALATNQQICAIPHMSPDTTAGSTHCGSSGCWPLDDLYAQYRTKYTKVVAKIPVNRAGTPQPALSLVDTV